MNPSDLFEILDALSAGIATTAVITASAFAIGALAGIPVALMRLSPNRALATVGRLYVEVVRGIPALVWLMIVFYGVGRYVELQPILASIIAFGAFSTAYLAEIYRAAIGSVARGQSEAAEALGLTPRQKFWRIVAPQGIEVALPPAATFGIGLIKESAAASVIGATDIAFWASNLTVQGRPPLATFLLAGLLYIALSIPVAFLARFADHKIRSRVAVS